MHRLLTRQLKRHFGKDFDYDKLDPVMLGFVKNIAQTYDEYDKEQRFMENTVDRNSQELNSAYELIDQKNKNLSKLLDERSKLLENRIEENKEIEVALKQYKQAMDATLLIYKFDKDGVLTFVNENLSRTSGYLEEELIGKTFSALCAENTLKDGFSHILERVHNKELYRDQMTNAQKNGDFYYVNAVIFPLLDKEGNIVEFMGILQDITEIEKSRQKAEDLEKAKSKFLANMNHELRTPLNAIIGFSQILKVNGELPERARGFIDKINSSGEHLLKLINTILDFSKIEAGQVELDNVEFLIDELITTAIDQVEFRAKEKGLKLEVDYEILKGKRFFGDKFKISQVLLNLLSNAVKFTHDGHVGLYVSQSQNDGMVRFEVHDTGIGLTAQQQKKLFEPFTQAHETTTRMYGGTGLGLTILKQLVELMNGKIWIESTLEAGSKFIFEIVLDEI